ncbi:MAG: ferrous iron transport protein B [Phycisphaerae bacterium]
MTRPSDLTKQSLAEPKTRPGQGDLRIALAGNPNSGKTTVFNRMTGARQHVGNYPGVTVEKKEGRASLDGTTLDLIDLPGTYSLTAYTIEEIVARNYIMDAQPDVVIDIIDCSNLERNLYLATQLLELGVPMVLAFNMHDVALSRGLDIDIEQLSRLFGVPIVPTVGQKGTGVDELLRTAAGVARQGDRAVAAQRHADYGRDVEPHVRDLTTRLKTAGLPETRCRWFAVKLLEGDSLTLERLGENLPAETLGPIVEYAADLRKRIEHHVEDEIEVILADCRYGFLAGAYSEAVRKPAQTRRSVTEKMDTVLLSRWLGLPIFAAMMYVVFWLTFTLGAYPMEWIEEGVGFLGQFVSSLWPVGSESVLRSLLVDGIIGGVGGVIVFLPNIVLLFLAIAFLEDSGYMARAAFLMDRLMHKIGLHGKSFIPMLIGFGCSVPAIMATRTLETRRDRLTTILILPLMSCGARLPIYVLIVPAFFPQAWRAPMFFVIYVVGILLAIVLAKLLRASMFRGESMPFVMELPPYRVPTVKGMLIHMWERSWQYIKKAGTIILGFSVLMWALSTFPQKTRFDRDYAALRTQAVEQFSTEAREVLTGPQLPDGVEQAILQAAEVRLTEGEEAFAEHFESIETERVRADVRSFYALTESIRTLKTEFEEQVAEKNLVSGSLEYHHAEQVRNEQLAHLREENPQLFPAAAAWRRKMDQPLAEAAAELEKLHGMQLREEVTYTIAGRVGMAMEPVIKPTMGFDWKIGTAMIGAIPGKEMFVSQMYIVNALGEEGAVDPERLQARLRADYSPLVGFCIMLFALASCPCVATVAATKKETGSWAWATGQAVGLTVLAVLITTIVYRGGLAMGIGV